MDKIGKIKNNKAKAISAELLEVNFKNKLDVTGKNWKKLEETGRNGETEEEEKHGKREETRY